MANTIKISEIQLFNSLKMKLGEKEAESLVSFIKEDVHNGVEDQVPNIATKDFVETKISEVEAKISEAKFQIILWAFVSWVSQLGAVLAFIKFIK